MDTNMLTSYSIETFVPRSAVRMKVMVLMVLFVSSGCRYPDLTVPSLRCPSLRLSPVSPHSCECVRGEQMFLPEFV